MAHFSPIALAHKEGQPANEKNSDASSECQDAGYEKLVEDGAAPRHTSVQPMYGPIPVGLG